MLRLLSRFELSIQYPKSDRQTDGQNFYINIGRQCRLCTCTSTSTVRLRYDCEDLQHRRRSLLCGNKKRQFPGIAAYPYCFYIIYRKSAFQWKTSEVVDGHGLHRLDVSRWKLKSTDMNQTAKISYFLSIRPQYRIEQSTIRLRKLSLQRFHVNPFYLFLNQSN